MVVESHCLQLQNAGKHIPATIEFQNFPGEHAPRPPLGARPSGPCQFFAQVSNSVALLFKTLMNPLSTESRSRYLQIPDCYKLSNGRFDEKHFLPVFYFHVLALNCTDATYSNYQLYSLGYQSRPCDIFMNLLSSSLPFTYFQ